jgi:hypothetical protein
MSSTSSGRPDLDLVEAVARRVVALLREEGLVPSEAPRLLTVAQVAREFGLSPDWVYGHARQLGAIRLGSGPKARLRFDRHTIGAQIARLASNGHGALPARQRNRGQGNRKRDGAELLPILDRPA